ncbi:hypothetical protein JOC59_001774 [Weissella beninensis]|nr:hypothetical protein [Periweissella beninensis]
MHTSNRFKERITFVVSIVLLIVAGILRRHEIIVLIFFLVPGIVLLFVSSFYTVKRRFTNLVVNIKNLFR